MPAARYCRRRLPPPVAHRDSEAGLYLWTTFGESTWDSIGRLAELGIIAGPGVFYGEDGEGYVRIALTASDEAVAKAAERLKASAAK